MTTRRRIRGDAKTWKILLPFVLAAAVVREHSELLARNHHHHFVERVDNLTLERARQGLKGGQPTLVKLM